jgi:hypothetical protein
MLSSVKEIFYCHCRISVNLYCCFFQDDQIPVRNDQVYKPKNVEVSHLVDLDWDSGWIKWRYRSTGRTT